MIRLLSSRRLGALLVAVALTSLAFAGPAFAAPSGGAGGEVLPVQILHNIYQWVVDGAKWIIPMALIAGIIYHLCIPNRRDVPKAAMFIFVMALIIIPVALATPSVVNKLKSLGTSAWDAGSSPSQSQPSGGRGTP